MKSIDLKEFDGKDYMGKVDLLDDILENSGLQYEMISGRASLKNVTYYSKDGKIVTSFVCSDQIDVGCMPVITNSDVYDELFSDKGLISIKTGGGKNKRLIPVKGGRVYVNTPLHRAVLHLIKGSGVQVDHRTHYTGCALREELRTCTARQNCMNKPCRSLILKKNRFKTKAFLDESQIKYLADNGFTYNGEYVYSKKYNTEDEMYKAIEFVENIAFGEFRYNPLFDFTETWYALILWKMLDLPEEDIMAYQRDYIINNKPEVAEYYGIA